MLRSIGSEVEADAHAACLLTMYDTKTVGRAQPEAFSQPPSPLRSTSFSVRRTASDPVARDHAAGGLRGPAAVRSSSAFRDLIAGRGMAWSLSNAIESKTEALCL